MKNNCLKRLLITNCYISIVILCNAQSNTPQTNQTKTTYGTGSTSVNVPSGYSATPLINYVRSWEPRVPITDPGIVTSITDVTQVGHATQFVDGLGRPLQTVSWQSSPIKTDLVSPQVYDSYGREQYKFLPYASSATDGMLKTNPFTDQSNFYSSGYLSNQPALSGEQYFYSHTQFEASPLNRVTKTFAPGNNWAGSEGGASEHAVSMQYQFL